MRTWWRVALATLFPFLDHDRRTWRSAMADQYHAAKRQIVIERELARAECPLVRDVFAPTRRRRP